MFDDILGLSSKDGVENETVSKPEPLKEQNIEDIINHLDTTLKECIQLF